MGAGTSSGGSATMTVTVRGEPTRGAVSSSLIDDDTKDLVVDSDGNEEDMTDAEQRVYLLMKTSYGSVRADAKLGLKIPPKLGPNVQKEVEAYVREALTPCTSDGSIKIRGVAVETVGTRLFAIVNWTDLKRNTKNTTRSPVTG